MKFSYKAYRAIIRVLVCTVFFPFILIGLMTGDFTLDIPKKDK